MTIQQTDPWQAALSSMGRDDPPATPDEVALFRYVVDKVVDRLQQPYTMSPWRGADRVEATREEKVAEIGGDFAWPIREWCRRVPIAFRAARVENLDAEAQHRDTLAGFLDTDGRTLFLAGPVGTGKSYAAWSVGHLAVAQSPRTRIHGWSTPRLLLDMRPDGDDRAFERACEADLLILDDIAAAKPTDWAIEQMYSIAEARCAANLRTIITTNASYDDLCQTWGEPMMDRWRNKSVTAVFRGKSRRVPLW